MEVDGGCIRDVIYKMNVGYRAWGVLKKMLLNNSGLGINVKKCLSIWRSSVPTALYRV